MTLKHENVTEKIIGAFFTVHSTLGYGFLEKVYENAMKLEMESQGLHVESQRQITVYYKGEAVGEYYADLCVENCVIVEIKTADQISAAHEAQLINYLKATGFEVGLLLNFGKKAEFRRKVF